MSRLRKVDVWCLLPSQSAHQIRPPPFAKTIMKLSKYFLPLILGCSVALTACETVPLTASTLLARVDHVLRTAPNPSGVAIRVTPPEIQTGQALNLEVRTAAPGYLYIFQIATDGHSLTMLFPNAIDGTNYVNGSVQLPRPTWRIVARGPQGVGYFLAVSAEQPQDLTALAAQVREGHINIVGRYAAAMAQLRELP